MKTNIENLPVIMEAPGMTMRTTQDWGGFDVSFHTLPKGADFTPLLKGLENDLCHCPHWGYIIEGKFRFIYADGSEETYETGDVYYAPAGHTAIADEDLKFIDLSPNKEHQEVLAHVGKVMASMG